jgi:hypothetical protein
MIDNKLLRKLIKRNRLARSLIKRVFLGGYMLTLGHKNGQKPYIYNNKP